jgi:hypothetical protein
MLLLRYRLAHFLSEKNGISARYGPSTASCDFTRVGVRPPKLDTAVQNKKKVLERQRTEESH